MKSLLTFALLISTVLATNHLAIQTQGQLSGIHENSCNFGHYAALGDSYAAGIGADPSGELPICNGSNGGDAGPYCTTEKCAKNTGAYAWQFHEKYQPTGSLDFFACSGADTQDCLSLQVPNINSSSDLITINIGGNNGRMFSKVVTRCVYLHTQLGCSGALSSAGTAIAGIEADLVTLIGDIKIKAPNAKIAVMSYVAFWPATDTPSQCQSASLERPTADQKTLMNTLVLLFNGVLAEVASQTGSAFVDTNAYFEGHRLCDTGDSYIQWNLEAVPGFTDGDNDGIYDPYLELFNHGVFHPFETGHQMYLEALSTSLGC